MTMLTRSTNIHAFDISEFGDIIYTGSEGRMGLFSINFPFPNLKELSELPQPRANGLDGGWKEPNADGFKRHHTHP